MDFIQIAESFLMAVKMEVDEKISKPSEIKIGNDGSVSLFTPAYFQFAIYGRGPGKKPPLDPILEWVENKRIQFRGKSGRFISYKSTAFAIQISIGKRGTKNYVKNAPDALTELINKHKGDYLKQLNKAVMDDENAEIVEIMQDTFPKDINFKI